MGTQTGRHDKKITIFHELNNKLRRLDATIGSDIKCPFCWQSFNLNDLSSLTIEHVPPVAAAKLINEEPLRTLTCKGCNNTYGTKYQRDIKHFLICQLHQHGKYDKPIRGIISMPDGNLAPLRSNIVLTRDKISVVGVPKANAPFVTREHISAWNETANKKVAGWRFSVTLDYGFKSTLAWSAYLHAAYLLAFILTNCHYAFTKAGVELRRLLTQGKTEQVGPCIITPPTIGLGGRIWIAEVSEPDKLKCLWLKVLGNIVILPLPDDGKLSCYKAWQKVSQHTIFGLLPRKTRLQILFQSKEDALDAQKCIGLSSETKSSN